MAPWGVQCSQFDGDRSHLHHDVDQQHQCLLCHRYLSSVEHSHTTTVCDICWLPGIELDRSGKVFSIRANSAGTSAQVRGGGYSIGYFL